MVETRRTSLNRRRRGTAYMLVLGSALLVTVIGLSSVVVARLQHRTAESRTSMSEASLYAQSACEAVVGATVVFQSFRTQWGLSNGQWYGGMPMGRGTIDFKLVDEIDGNLNNDTDQPVRIYGKGQVDDATQYYSVVAEPRALSCLSVALYAPGSCTTSVSSTLTVIGAPVYCSTNDANYGSGVFTNSLWATVNGDVMAKSISKWFGSTITGTATPNAPPLELPSSSTVTYYQSMAVTIPYASLPSSRLNRVILSYNSNPYGSTQAEGVYYINATGDLAIRDCRIQGTLVINLASGKKLTISEGIYWEPHRPDYPALIVRGECDIAIDHALSEAGTGVNFNPAGLPYDGVTDSDTSDTYSPSVIKGLVHVVTGPLTIRQITRIEGCVILAGSSVTTGNNATIVYNPNLALYPPKRYRSYRLNIVPGTWRREMGP